MSTTSGALVRFVIRSSNRTVPPGRAASDVGATVSSSSETGGGGFARPGARHVSFSSSASRSKAPPEQPGGTFGSAGAGPAAGDDADPDADAAGASEVAVVVGSETGSGAAGAGSTVGAAGAIADGAATS